MSLKHDLNIVSISALGKLHTEVDIQVLAEDVPFPIARYEPEMGASLFRFEEDGELMILYSSGKYILRGGDDFDQVYDANDRFLRELSNIGIHIENPSLTVKNVVTLGDLERSMNLNTLAIELGLQQVEYEPEQFPGLVFRPSGTQCVLLVFSSGKIVITGGKTKEENKEAFSVLLENIEQEMVCS